MKSNNTNNKLTNIQIAQTCFEILGRYFPGESGKDTEELRQILKINDTISSLPNKAGMSSDAAAWKCGASIWLANNMSFKKKTNK